MTFKLFLQLVLGVFSFRPRHMRGFNLKRVGMVLIMVPIFSLLLVVNNAFLLLDWVLFPYFWRQQVKEPVFIVSAPRSATTYLFHALEQSEQFTAIKLWEMVLAPSICQKRLVLGVLRLDRLVGGPIKKTALWLENKLIGDLKQYHRIGLNLPEEDEAMLLWSLSTFYLNFFYPDSTFFDDLVLFDARVKPRRKARIMRQYERYVQRHNFVFNRQDTKRYLSKNPIMMGKIQALSISYPDAKIININRSPAKTIPSTIQLNEKLYRLFTSRPMPTELKAKSLEMLVEWYAMADSSLESHFAGQYVKVDFMKLVKRDPIEVMRISEFIDAPAELLMVKQASKVHKSEKGYAPLPPAELEEVFKRIPFMSDYQ